MHARPLVQLLQMMSPCAHAAAAQVDWFFTREQEASTEALAHRWDPAGSAAVARLESFLEQVRAVFWLQRTDSLRAYVWLSAWVTSPGRVEHVD
jgi:hypothetical protein